MKNAVIRSVGMYVPDRVIPNAFFNELLGEDVDTWLRENVHIYERRWCESDESTADPSSEGRHQALAQVPELSAEALDMIIVATDTPEYISPATATKVQHRLEAINAPADMNNACAGFAYALDIATKFLKADDRYKNILVVGAYAMSKYLNMEDKKTVTLFADGAGAVILEAQDTDDKGFLASELSTQGQYCDWMGIYGGGTYKPISPEVVEQKDHLLKFVKKFPSELNPETWSGMIQRLCERSGVKPADIDHFFITQININSIWATMDILNLPREKAHTVMHHYGYTGSACIPMALADAYEQEKIKSGDLICFIGSGGGLSFGGSIFRV